jgi:beta-aspartyl-dipeptidase (metallo-type)
VLTRQVRELVTKHGFALDLVLPLVTSNPARVLKLERTGRLAAECDADIVVLAPGTLEVREVIAQGRRVVIDGRSVLREKFLAKSKRVLHLVGDEAPEGVEQEVGHH